MALSIAPTSESSYTPKVISSKVDDIMQIMSIYYGHDETGISEVTIPPKRTTETTHVIKVIPQENKIMHGRKSGDMNMIAVDKNTLHMRDKENGKGTIKGSDGISWSNENVGSFTKRVHDLLVQNI